ncbi:hypothetical protein [Aeromonas sp. QDB66]|uniref:hypothetical protein n=1 Tax=Aeromonas sp. QDB66 TaxID=2989824 RepID=UPI0022E27EE8|nr:hypothetical protein [Aeromonas sp. QDB66]
MDSVSGLPGWIAISLIPIVFSLRFDCPVLCASIFPLPQGALPASDQGGKHTLSQVARMTTPPSTLSHHIAAQVCVGLITLNREGRTLLCVSQYEVLEEIIAFFREECCVNDKRE